MAIAELIIVYSYLDVRNATLKKMLHIGEKT